MTQSTEILASLKRAANYSKLAMHNEGPRSYKRGQGALMKVTYKFGNAKKGISLKKLCEVLGWNRRETMDVAKKAAKNGYVTVQRKASGKRRVKLTDLGNEILQKRFEAENRAADEVLSYLTDAEREQLLALCEKVSDACEEMGIDYAEIEEKKCGRRHVRRHEHAHRIMKRGKDAKAEEGEKAPNDEKPEKSGKSGKALKRVKVLKKAKAAKDAKAVKDDVVAAPADSAPVAQEASAEPEKTHHGFHGFHLGRSAAEESRRAAALDMEVVPMSGQPMSGPAPKPATTPTPIKPGTEPAQN